MAALERRTARHASLLLPLLVVLAAALPWGPAYAAALQGRVVAVADGDTLTVLAGRERVRVRLSYIDAPERGQPFGRRSRQSLGELCHQRMAVVNVAGRDRYGRVLGIVSCEGVIANREQVKRGLAWVYSRYARRDSPLYEVEREARKDRRGLWQASDPQAPWQWRSRKRASRAGAPA